ncbi:MAG: hypothetical protein LBU80_01625 [Rikenellaceae bacterium]|nr:hypothetical protein [Rikenellaceae bacterium]
MRTATLLLFARVTLGGLFPPVSGGQFRRFFQVNGSHPLMIRVCKDGKKKYLSLSVSVQPRKFILS